MVDGNQRAKTPRQRENFNRVRITRILHGPLKFTSEIRRTRPLIAVQKPGKQVRLSNTQETFTPRGRLLK